jgi:hypothetical protein
LPAGIGAPGAANAQFYDLSWKRFRAFVGLRWFL